ncbi:MAG TPA: hypothetical protein VEB43_16235 [Anaeromyxobacter sp.]|nr:hypothetical protein [Anaeromyxobacter sp.]
MRFLVDPGAAPRARPAVRAWLLFAALALAAFAVQRALQGGLTPGGVEAFYLGPDGTEPVAAVALWEELHVGAFVWGFALFMLGALAAAAPAPAGRGLFRAAVAAAAADLAAPFAVVGAGGAGALRVATTALAFALVAALLVAVARATVPRGAPARD